MFIFLLMTDAIHSPVNYLHPLPLFCYGPSFFIKKVLEGALGKKKKKKFSRRYGCDFPQNGRLDKQTQTRCE